MYALIMYLLGVLTAAGWKHEKSKQAEKRIIKDKRHCFPDSPIPVVSLLPPETDEQKADQKKRKTRESIKFWSELFGLIVLVVYAVATIAIWCANKNAADAAKNAADVARDTLLRSQRPWVGLAGPINPQRFQLNPEVSIQTALPLKNFGTSPALKVMATIEPVDNKGLHERAPHVCDLILRFVNGTIPENQLQGPQIKRGFTLFPGEVLSEGIGTGDSTLKPGSVDTLYFIGCIAYRDQFEKTHTTHFCVETPWLAKSYKLGQPLISCSVYNEVD
jgi:hypothetical protein